MPSCRGLPRPAPLDPPRPASLGSRSHRRSMVVTRRAQLRWARDHTALNGGDPPRPASLGSRSPLDSYHDDPLRQPTRSCLYDLRRPADSSQSHAGDRRRRLRVADRHSGGDDSGADGGHRCRRTGANRHRQNGGFRDPDPVQNRRHQQSNASTGAGPHSRAGAASGRGVQPLRRSSAADQRPAGLWRVVVHRATGRAATRRAGGGRHSGPGHRPLGTRDTRPVARGLSGARRGRRDARHGFRRRRRAHPVRNARIQTGGTVFGDHAPGDPQDHHQVPARSVRSRIQGEKRHSREHHTALHPGRRPAQDGRADPNP